MMPKFSIEEHEKRMRDLLKPKPQGNIMLEKLREVALSKRIPKQPTEGAR